MDKWQPDRWIEYPMGYADSYGYFWALTPGLKTVCGGKTKDVLRRGNATNEKEGS